MSTKESFFFAVYHACRYGSAFSVEEAIQREIELSADYREFYIALSDKQSDKFINKVFKQLKNDNYNTPKFGKNTQ